MASCCGLDAFWWFSGHLAWVAISLVDYVIEIRGVKIEVVAPAQGIPAHPVAGS
jgi:hypothetical protein